MWSSDQMHRSTVLRVSPQRAPLDVTLAVISSRLRIPRGLLHDRPLRRTRTESGGPTVCCEAAAALTDLLVPLGAGSWDQKHPFCGRVHGYVKPATTWPAWTSSSRAQRSPRHRSQQLFAETPPGDRAGRAGGVELCRPPQAARAASRDRGHDARADRPTPTTHGRSLLISAARSRPPSEEAPSMTQTPPGLQGAQISVSPHHLDGEAVAPVAPSL